MFQFEETQVSAGMKQPSSCLQVCPCPVRVSKQRHKLHVWMAFAHVGGRALSGQADEQRRWQMS